MTKSKRNSVAIIGSGSVGIAIAQSLIIKKLGCEIHLFDLNSTKLKGEVYDLEDSTYSTNCLVRESTLKECNQCDIIIVTAGVKQKKSESRDMLMERNKEVLNSIVQGMKPINKDSIWLIVSNPVDTLTSITQHLTGLPNARVIGAGTFLDSVRLRVILSKQLEVYQNNIHASIIGEHGEDQMVLWSSASIASTPLLKFAKADQLNLKELERSVIRKAYDIIDLKGVTCFGIAGCVSSICQSIFTDSKEVRFISCFHPKYEVYLSYPCILGRDGVINVCDPSLSVEESDRLKSIIENLKAKQA